MLDLALIQIQEREQYKVVVPSFIAWVDEVIEQNKKLPRIRNGYEKNRGSPESFQALQAYTTPDATSD